MERWKIWKRICTSISTWKITFSFLEHWTWKTDYSANFRMAPQPQQRLADDHDAVSELLKQLRTAVGKTDVQTIYCRLNLLWARLAVHIRAEHLHLFPAIAARVTGAQSLLDSLRADHNFFMRELAQAIGILRELPRTISKPADEAKLDFVRDAVREVQKRLATDNEIEEHQICRWCSAMLSETEQ